MGNCYLACLYNNNIVCCPLVSLSNHHEAMALVHVTHSVCCPICLLCSETANSSELSFVVMYPYVWNFRESHHAKDERIDTELFNAVALHTSVS